jgi:hypothetical protein
MFTSARRVYVEVVVADGHASVSPSGAAAAAPPAGAHIFAVKIDTFMERRGK